jgi:hypothetical protein
LITLSTSPISLISFPIKPISSVELILKVHIC